MATTEELLDELIRLQALQIRRSLPSQADAIEELSSAGLSAPRIADLLGTTAATVRMAIKRQKDRERKSGPRRPKTNPEES